MPDYIGNIVVPEIVPSGVFSATRTTPPPTVRAPDLPTCCASRKRYSKPTRPKGGLLNAAPGAAIGEFPVDHHRRDAANSVLPGLRGDILSLHVQNLDFTRRTSYLVDQGDSFLARRASGAEDFNLSFYAHSSSPLLFHRAVVSHAALGAQSGGRSERPAIPQ